MYSRSCAERWLSAAVNHNAISTPCQPHAARFCPPPPPPPPPPSLSANNILSITGRRYILSQQWRSEWGVLLSSRLRGVSGDSCSCRLIAWQWLDVAMLLAAVKGHRIWPCSSYTGFSQCKLHDWWGDLRQTTKSTFIEENSQAKMAFAGHLFRRLNRMRNALQILEWIH